MSIIDVVSKKFSKIETLDIDTITELITVLRKIIEINDIQTFNSISIILLKGIMELKNDWESRKFFIKRLQNVTKRGLEEIIFYLRGMNEAVISISNFEQIEEIKEHLENLKQNINNQKSISKINKKYFIKLLNDFDNNLTIIYELIEKVQKNI